MALWLPRKKLILLEVPRTGTTWMRSVLAHLHFEHVIMSPNQNVCPRHSPASAYWIPRGSRICCTLRNPFDWMCSCWHHVNGASPFLEDRHYLHRDVWPEGIVEISLQDWWRWYLRQGQPVVSKMFEEFVRGTDVVLRFGETLSEEFADLVGLPREAVCRIPRANVSPRVKQSLPNNLKRQFQTLEQSAFEIWNS